MVRELGNSVLSVWLDDEVFFSWCFNRNEDVKCFSSSPCEMMVRNLLKRLVWSNKNNQWIINIRVCWLQIFLWLSLAIYPCQSLLLVSLLNSIQCLHKSDACKFLLVGQNRCVHVSESIGKFCLWVRLYFSTLSCSSYLDGLWDEK